jgi:hypothetical protein
MSHGEMNQCTQKSLAEGMRVWANHLKLWRLCGTPSAGGRAAAAARCIFARDRAFCSYRNAWAISFTASRKRKTKG